MSSWYGWIPILSGKLFLPEEEDIEKSARKLQSQIREEEEYNIEYEYNSHEHDRWKIKLITEEDELLVDCKLEDNGFYEITSIDGDASYGSVCTIHRFIRDVYHKHIHHSGDLPLYPVLSNDKKSAIEEILNQYRQKVRDYHQESKDFINSGRLDDALYSIFSGRGEMQFAKSFANLFFTGERRESYIKTFENSDKSLAVLMDKINTLMIPILDKRKDMFYLLITVFFTFLTMFSVFSTFFVLELNICWSLLFALLVFVIGCGATQRRSIKEKRYDFE